MKNNKSVYTAYFGLFFMTMIIGLSFLFVKVGLEYSNPIDLLAHRFSIGLLTIIFLIVFKIIQVPQITIKKLKTLLLLAVFFPVSFFLFQTYGMKYSSASEAGIIFAISPIVTLIFAQIFLKEKTTIMQKIGILLSVFGIIYIIVNKGNFSINFTNIKDVFFYYYQLHHLQFI